MFFQSTHFEEVLVCMSKQTRGLNNCPTQSEAVTHNSDTPSIFARTAAPFHASTRGSTSFGGGIIVTFSIFGTKGVAIACNLETDE